jgi:hypothetical protein
MFHFVSEEKGECTGLKNGYHFPLFQTKCLVKVSAVTELPLHIDFLG